DDLDQRVVAVGLVDPAAEVVLAEVVEQRLDSVGIEAGQPLLPLLVGLLADLRLHQALERRQHVVRGDERGGRGLRRGRGGGGRRGAAAAGGGRGCGAAAGGRGRAGRAAVAGLPRGVHVRRLD